MTHKLVTGTMEGWIAYALETGSQGPTGAHPTTKEQFTALEAEQALARAINYINSSFYRKFKPEYMAETLETLPINVKEDLAEATYIAAGHELLTPGTYSVTVRHNDATGQEVKKLGPVEYYQSRSADTVQRVVNEQTLNSAIHALLDCYKINPAGSELDEVPFRFAGVGPRP